MRLWLPYLAVVGFLALMAAPLVGFLVDDYLWKRRQQRRISRLYGDTWGGR